MKARIELRIVFLEDRELIEKQVIRLRQIAEDFHAYVEELVNQDEEDLDAGR